MSEAKVALNLTRAEAVVLIEFLMRFRDNDILAIEHDSEEQLLWDLCCVVEQQLPELFDPQWRTVVERARATVLAEPNDERQACCRVHPRVEQATGPAQPGAWARTSRGA